MFSPTKRQEILRLAEGQTYRPAKDFIVLEPIESESITAGKIVLPEGSMPPTAVGKIIRVGPGMQMADGRLTKMEHAEGEIVVLSPINTVFELYEGRRKLYVAGDRDIVATIDGYVETPKVEGETAAAEPSEASKLILSGT